MKKAIIVSAVAGMLFFTGGLILFAQSWKDTRQTQNSLSAGRYQLFQGVYSISLKPESVKEEGVFKIDTQTGSVWVYLAGQDSNGTSYSEWNLIKE
ncbi:MAG: hypothetical protein HY033_09335 [Ignavibacteriae bacterium]|nr:hypothetical protein [Ignavibacteriota bacterium]